MLEAAPPPGKLASDVPDLVESGHQPHFSADRHRSVSPEVAVTASRQSLLQPLLEPIEQ